MFNTMLNLNRTFGIEIECFIPRARSIDSFIEICREEGLEGVTYEGYTHRITRGWKIVTDVSICAGAGHRGIEVVSPILKGVDGLNQVQAMCRALNRVNANVNKSCGLHVHHDAQDFASKHFDNIKEMYRRMEPELDKMMPASRRGTRVEYVGSCIGVTNETWEYTRYRKLNLCSYARQGTIEFRHHSGTVDAEKIVAWVHITQAIMERAKGRKFNTTVKNRQYLFDGLKLWGFNAPSAEIKALNDTVRNYINNRQKKFGFGLQIAAAA